MMESSSIAPPSVLAGRSISAPSSNSMVLRAAIGTSSTFATLPSSPSAAERLAPRLRAGASERSARKRPSRNTTRLGEAAAGQQVEVGIVPGLDLARREALLAEGLGGVLAQRHHPGGAVAGQAGVQPLVAAEEALGARFEQRDHAA
jgi:hypothetical protein